MTPVGNLTTRARIVLLAIGAASPAIGFAAYLMLQQEAIRHDVIAYGLAALLAVVLVVLIAWVGADHLVLAPIRTMLDASRRVSAGDLGARTGMQAGSEELSQLGAQLDAMVERLEARDRELQRVVADLQHQAMTDALTGLYNRRFFWDALARQCAESRRTGNRFCVILLDIDRFKQVNDRWGHGAGDRVLTAIGTAIAASIRESDVAARYGGEEFTILLPDTELQIAAERAEGLRAEIGALQFEQEGGRIGVTVSLGVAEWTRTLDDAADLMRTVDAAMYEAKSHGRDRVVAAGAVQCAHQNETAVQGDHEHAGT